MNEETKNLDEENKNLRIQIIVLNNQIHRKLLLLKELKEKIKKEKKKIKMFTKKIIKEVRKNHRKNAYKNRYQEK